MSKEVKLTAKQELFCREYLVDLNATKAAIRAGYSEKTAYSTGHENLKKPEIEAHIQTLFDARVERTKLNSDYVLNNLQKTYELDIIDILSDDLKNFKPVSEWPKQWRISISGIDLLTISSSQGEDLESVVKKIKWPDKISVLEKIGKHTKIGAFIDKVDHTSSDGSMSPVTIIGSDVNPQDAAKLYQKIMGKG